MILTAITLVFLVALTGAAPTDDLTIKTPLGPVVGHYAKGGNETTVVEFLGIPYTKPPVGALRFLPPQKPEKWTTPVVAAKFSPGCMQTAFVPGLIRQPEPTSQSEDCLTVNIWAPTKIRNKRSGAAVILWMHGGGFAWGVAETPLYSGANIVRDNEDIIMVSFNRLNIFGFPAAPGLEDKKLNLGLLDVRAAVEWTRDNIVAFGGDPRKITLVGESAGGAGVHAYTLYAKNDPIIHGAIMQSGQVTIPTSGTPGRFGPRPEVWGNLSLALNCSTTPGPENLDCVRAVPATTLKKAMTTTGLTAFFAPVADNGTIFTDTAARLAGGSFARIPTIMGSNDNEFPGLDNVTLAAFTCPAAISAAAHAKRVPTWHFRWFGNFPTYVGAPDLGAYHGTEISNIFGTFNPAIATPEQVASSKYIQGAWVAFAKNPWTGLAVRYRWPPFDPEKKTLVQLAYNNSAAANFERPEVYEAACAVAA